ncbi:quinoprotein dehydrogenase-associated putative ABC transporter substrate-binding protein [Emcibacter sp.]|uniref:quinoprotein dehydrogenase-associated putative ABC transporter substrate-binding protein n=1 Tax=Emcibacter sp. TaxID=1979954 RepID=UPI003A8F863F
MSFRHLILLLSFSALLVPVVRAQDLSPDKLRVCADPNNLPYSNRKKMGFENRIAELIAAALGLELEYTWFPQRMGFIRNTLKSWDDEKGRFRCDLVIGVPAGFDISDTTSTYYRSTYVIVVREKGPLGNIKTAADITGLSVDQKQSLRIGAFAPSPSVDWLNTNGLFEQTRFHRVMTGDPDYYPGKIIEDELVPGELDAVVIWGPIAGYFASQNPDAGLRIIPLLSEPGMRFDFAMAMGVRRRENDWKARIEKSLSDNREKILTILHEYQVPLVENKQTVELSDDDD